MKPIYQPHNTVIRENAECVVEVIEDGEYGAGTDRVGMPYSRIVGSFSTVAAARRVFPHARVEQSTLDLTKARALAAYQTSIVDQILPSNITVASSNIDVAPSSMDTEVEPDPTFDAASDIRYDNQGVPY